VNRGSGVLDVSVMTTDRPSDLRARIEAMEALYRDAIVALAVEMVSSPPPPAKRSLWRLRRRDPQRRIPTQRRTRD
jgi:hypothetical protein